jgi:hypothetical protein
MSRAYIQTMIEAFASAGQRVAQSGFDGVEIHGANGYLVHEFMSPAANRRTDEYGGSVRNRARFAVEVTEAVRQAIPDAVILGMRLGAEEYIPDGLRLDETLEIIDRLMATGCLDYLSITAGSYGSLDRVVPGMYFTPGLNAELGKAVKQHVNIPVLLAGRITEPALADQLIADGCADMVGMARALIADPELPAKAAEGRLDDIRHCIGINQGCWARMRVRYPIGCVYNPEVGREEEFSNRKVASKPKSVLVIGGGPAGCEAARQFALDGHRVTLCEKGAALGGMTLIAAMAPGRADLSEVSRWYTHELSRLAVVVRLGLELTEQTLAGFAPDAVVLATGAKPTEPSIEGLESTRWLTIPEALSFKFDAGKKVLIYTVSREIDPLTVADKLSDLEGRTVILATPHDAVGRNVDDSTILSITRRLAMERVQIIPHVQLSAVDGDNIVLSNVFSNARTIVEEVWTLILDYGWESVRHLEDPLRTQYPEMPVIRVGDCLAPRGLQAAVWDGASVRGSL